MMDIIKRVISGEDMEQESSSAPPPRSYQNYNEEDHEEYDDDAIGMQIDDDEDSPGNTYQDNNNFNNNSLESHVSARPAVVENDMEMVGASDFHYIASGSMTPRSSLSDVSAAQRLDMNEDAMDEALGISAPYNRSSSSIPGEEVSGDAIGAWAVAAAASGGVGVGGTTSSAAAQVPNQLLGAEMNRTVHRTNLAGQPATRGGDRYSGDESSSFGKGTGGGSQSSSRDWGWFEDVHASDGGHGGAAEGSLNGSLGGGGGGRSNNKNNNSNSNNKQKTTTATTYTGMVPSSRGSFQYYYHETLQPLRTRDPETDAAAMAVTAPTYVLEESLSSQRLWKHTAGQRPPQPMEERAFFEKMWAQNFARSQVEYRMPVEVLTATTPISLNPFADGNFDAQGGVGNQLSNYNLAGEANHHVDPSGGGSGGGGGLDGPGGSKGKKNNASHMAEAALMRKLHEPARYVGGVEASASGCGGDCENAEAKKITMTSNGDTLTVCVKGDNVFGTTVSKSFARPSENGGPIKGVDTVNISVASYRVVESQKHGKYAQFLVIYREGSIRDTIGVWKRYSDFQELSRKVTQAHEGCAAVIANMSPLAVAEEHEVEHLPNAITSWRLLKKRQRWYRCLDAGYLSLKVFLLERFLHDILFESSSPDLLRDFVGVPQPRN